MKDNKKHLGIIAIIGLVAIVIITYVLMDQATAPTLVEPTPIASNDTDIPLDYIEYDTKIVYSMSPNVKVERFQADCDARGGIFKECGSPCAPDAEACMTVCALTCEFASESDLGDLIVVESPQPDEVITNPLIVSGKARGSWFFEAEFPVVLTNWDGLIIAEGQATAEGEWMTNDFVPFQATLEFEMPEYGDNGSLILQKANPSGLPENDAAEEFMIRFR